MASTKRSIIPRLICRWLDFHCPQAKQRLATAVLGSVQLPHCTDDEADAIGSGDREECTVGAQTFDLRLEAIGSGVLLLSGLTIASTASVWDLKTLIALERTNTPAGRQRLFVGHGGIELLDDTAPLNEFLFSQRTLSMMLVDFEFQLLIVLLHGNILHRVRRSIICTVKVGLKFERRSTLELLHLRCQLARGASAKSNPFTQCLSLNAAGINICFVLCALLHCALRCFHRAARRRHNHGVVVEA